MTTVQQTRWVGWVRFAGVIMLLSGAFSFIQGLVVLIAPDPYFVLADGSLFLLDLNGWGWWSLIVGILLMLTAGGLFSGATWARVIGVVFASLSAVGQLLLIPVQPWWAIVVIAVDILVIYAVTAHGRELRGES